MEASKAYLTIVCLGIFAVMALSNAIVPVLPAFAGQSAWQGAIYAAYFFGAFISTLPGGVLADRHGSVPVIRVGLLMTVAAGILLFVITSPLLVIILRGCEGIGAGLFVAAALSYVNSRSDHTRMSGYYMAMLNLGLVLGLIVAGLLAVRFAQPALGIGVFTLFALVALAGSAVTGNRLVLPAGDGDTANISAFIRDNLWLWYSAVILVGITGVVSSLYPKFSHDAPDTLGLWIAGMSIATIVTVLVVTYMPLRAGAGHPLVRALHGGRCSSYLCNPAWLHRARRSGRCRDDRPDGVSCRSAGSPGPSHGIVLDGKLSGDGDPPVPCRRHRGYGRISGSICRHRDSRWNRRCHNRVVRVPVSPPCGIIYEISIKQYIHLR